METVGSLIFYAVLACFLIVSFLAWFLIGIANGIDHMRTNLDYMSKTLDSIDKTLAQEIIGIDKALSRVDKTLLEIRQVVRYGRE